MPHQEHPPLYLTVLRVAGIWLVADAGYWTILPAIGVDLSYNSAPFIIAGYFLFWSALSVWGFQSELQNLLVENRLWVQVAAVALFGFCAAALLNALSLLGVPDGKLLVPYSDILLATPWYFLPKSMEILLQQVLIASLVLALGRSIRSIKNIAYAYALLFGGAHAAIFLLSDAPTPYMAVMTIGAIASSAVFPYLMLRVRNGFFYSFIIHWTFYMVLALVLHAWPPPGYLPHL